MWKQYKKLRKFMEKESVEKIVGAAKFQVSNRPLFYYGNGFLLGFTTRKFRIENLERIEYGEEGQYLMNIYHFANKELLMKYLNVEDFEDSGIATFEDDIIEGHVNYLSKYSEICKLHKRLGNNDFFQCGIDKVLSNGEFVFRNRFIFWDSFKLFFEEDSPKAKLSGFQYTPNE